METAIEHLKKNMEAFKDEPVMIKLELMANLLEEAKKAKIKITDEKIPKPEIVLK